MRTAGHVGVLVQLVLQCVRRRRCGATSGRCDHARFGRAPRNGLRDVLMLMMRGWCSERGRRRVAAQIARVLRMRVVVVAVIGFEFQRMRALLMLVARLAQRLARRMVVRRMRAILIGIVRVKGLSIVRRRRVLLRKVVGGMLAARRFARH